MLTWYCFITLSFLSCLAYGKHGITAVTRCADAILHALIIINSSIKLSLMSPQPLWTMKTSSPRTDSPISTLKKWETELNIDSWQVANQKKKTRPLRVEVWLLNVQLQYKIIAIDCVLSFPQLWFWGGKLGVDF